MKIPASLLPHTITVTKKAGESAYGPIYAAPEQLKARIEFSTGSTKNNEGQDTTYQARIFLAPEDETKIGPETDITFMGYAFSVIRVAPQYDIWGNPSHIEVEAEYG